MIRFVSAGLAIAVVLTGCSRPDPLLQRVRERTVTVGELVVSRFYALPPFTDAPMAAYVQVSNVGTTPDTLSSVTSAAPYPTPTIHGADMISVGALLIAPGEALSFEPGGLHLMFEPPLPEVSRGDSVPVTLHFVHTGEVRLWLPVIEYTEVDKVRPRASTDRPE